MKSIILLLFLLALASNTNAQIITDYGFKLGLGISNHSWEYKVGSDLEFGNKVGISPRLFAEFLDLSFFQLQAEIGYLPKGFEEKIKVTTAEHPDGTGQFITTNNRLGYLSISALAKFKFEKGLFTPYIIAGPQLNILISKDVEKIWEVFYDSFKENNLGFSIGAGTEVKNWLPISLLLEYRFERDFSDNYDSPNINIKNYSHVILIGVKF